MTEAADTIVDVLRGRIVRGIQAGILSPGERLATSREVAAEFGVDYRLAIAAYKTLQQEGIVELRPRGGVYVAERMRAVPDAASLAEGWFVDMLSSALQRDIPAPDLPDRVQRAISTLRLRTVVLAATDDQCHGLSRELREDFGLETDGVVGSSLRDDALPPAVRRCDLVVSTEAFAARALDLGTRLHRPVVIISVRSELRSGEWAMLLRQPVWAIVATAEFGAMLTRFFSAVPGAENLTVLVHGHDDLGVIPKGAPTYVTQRVRTELDLTTISGRVLPAARTISAESARELFGFIVQANLRALQAMRRS